MPKPSSDTFRKFVVVAASFVISFIIFGVARLAGQLFVACRERFNTGRKEASLPFVLCFTIRNLSGPVVGYLGNKFGLREITLSGCVLASIAVGACFLVEDIVLFTVLWGGCYGMGFGMGSTLIPNILHLYFDTNFNKIHGIYQAGGCMGSLILPAICEYLLNIYGVSGTLLILSGFILNCVPTAMLLRNPRTTSAAHNPSRDVKAPKTQYEKLDQSNSISDGKYSKFSLPKEISAYASEIKPNAYDSGKQLNTTKFSASQCDISTEKTEIQTICHANHLESQSHALPTFANQNSKNVADAIITDESTFLYKITNDKITIHHLHENDTRERILLEPEVRKISKSLDASDSNCHCCPMTKLCKQFGSFLKDFQVLLDPTYILILISMGMSTVVATTLYTVIVDACRDKGIVQDVAVLMTFAVTDMLGRFFLGYATDEGYFSEVNVFVMCCGFFGLLLMGFVWLKYFYMVLLDVAAIGVLAGGIIVVPVGIIRKFTEKDNINMAFASRYILFGVFGFAQSPVIGYFRETLRSYDGLFYLMGSMCVLASIVASLIPLAAKYRDYRKASRANLKISQIGL